MYKNIASDGVSVISTNLKKIQYPPKQIILDFAFSITTIGISVLFHEALIESGNAI